jgi:hypothetical protein
MKQKKNQLHKSLSTPVLNKKLKSRGLLVEEKDEWVAWDDVEEYFNKQ